MMRYLISVLILAMTLFFQLPVLGQSEAPQVTKVESLSFANLSNYIDETIRGPYGSVRYRFSLPDNWQLADSIEASLQISMISTNPAQTANLLQVYFNNIFIQSFSLTLSGNHSLNFTIPAAALTSYIGDNRHELYLIFDARAECGTGNQSVVILKNTSTMTFHYTESALDFNLRKLPNPIYQNTFETQSAFIVIPDSPSETVLQAALITSAAFGQMSNEKLPITLVTATELQATDKAASHLIYVGRPDSFPELANVVLPLLIQDNQFNPAFVASDSGVLQMVANPQNPLRALLFVSGSTDIGVVKAAQALSYGQILSYNVPNLAIIDSTNFLQTTTASEMQQISFADAGYETTLVDKPANTLYYHFYLPYANEVQDGAVLNLAVDHSRLIDFTGSGIRIRLNGAPIGSIELSNDTAELAFHPILIPVTSLIAGMNEIALDIDLRPRSGCFDEISRQLWLNIYDLSNLELPISTTPNTAAALNILKGFPAPFNFAPNLETTRFVLQANAPESWNIAAQLAAYLGNRVIAQGIAFNVSLDNNLSEEILSSSNLIIIGNPETHQAVPALDAKLAEQAGTETVNQVEPQVGYSFAADSNYAYLQFMNSPWNSAYSIMTIFSHQEQGLQEAVNALLIPEMRTTLRGNFAIIQGTDILVNTVNFTSTNTENLGTDAQTESSPSLVLDNQTRIIIFVIVGISVLVIVLLVIGVMRLLQGRSSGN